MEHKFDCKTSLYPDKTIPWQEAPHRGVITDGFSQEALFYVNQAVARTQENGYSVFDEYGLMPNSYDFFDEAIKSHVLKICDYEEDGTICTADERFLIEVNHQDDTRTVYYDSDGYNGYDRSATYAITQFGSIKLHEKFNADGDDINEVEITTDRYSIEKKEKEVKNKEKNPDYNWFDKFLNLFNMGDDEYIIVEKPPITWNETERTITIGVNADDLGYDKKGGNHFEYKEQVTEYSEKETEVNYQMYLKWRYADTNECKRTYK